MGTDEVKPSTLRELQWAHELLSDKLKDKSIGPSQGREIEEERRRLQSLIVAAIRRDQNASVQADASNPFL